MNKYEKLFRSIHEQTETKKIKWKQISKTAHSELIFNSNLVFRQFSGKYEKGDDTFEVLFVEKKTDVPEYDFVYEKYAPEILIIDEDKELLVTLTDSMIDKSEMMRLVQIIEENNDRASKLFD